MFLLLLTNSASFMATVGRKRLCRVCQSASLNLLLGLGYRIQQRRQNLFEILSFDNQNTLQNPSDFHQFCQFRLNSFFVGLFYNLITGRIGRLFNSLLLSIMRTGSFGRQIQFISNFIHK